MLSPLNHTKSQTIARLQPLAPPASDFHGHRFCLGQLGMLKIIWPWVKIQIVPTPKWDPIGFEPEPCKELRRRPLLFMVGIVPYLPSSTRVLIVAHMFSATIVSLFAAAPEPMGLLQHVAVHALQPKQIEQDSVAFSPANSLTSSGLMETH